MSEFDRIRDLMGDLAGNPPPPLDRTEAVMSRISRRLQRQAALRGVAMVAFVSLVGVGAVTTSLHLTNTGLDSKTDHPGTSASPSPTPTRIASPRPSGAGHTSSGEPTTAPSPTAGKPSNSASAPPSTEPGNATAGATPGPTGAASAPPVAPSPENTAASGPLTVTVSMSPARVDTGAETRALVSARSGNGRLLAVDIAWGDGQTFHFSPGQTACPRTTHLDGSFPHRYSTAGSFTVHVTVTTGDCGPQEQVSRDAAVTVTGTGSGTGTPAGSSAPSPQPDPAPGHTNGPAQPVAGAATATGDNPANVYVHVSGSDQDGFVRRVATDWGDGTSPAVGEWATSSCADAAGTAHPAPTSHDATVSHHYANAGGHTVTVTVTSVACDGSQSQTGSTTLSVTQQ